MQDVVACRVPCSSPPVTVPPKPKGIGAAPAPGRRAVRPEPDDITTGNRGTMAIRSVARGALCNAMTGMLRCIRTLRSQLVHLAPLGMLLLDQFRACSADAWPSRCRNARISSVLSVRAAVC